MANNVKNVLKFKNLNQDQIWDIVNRITNFNPDDPLGESSHIDFNNIIPEPKTKEECPEDCLITPDSHVMKDKDRPWFDWYEWRNKHWSTKWNAYDGYTIIGKTNIIFVFNTAWNVPASIYTELIKMYPDVKIEVQFANEDYRSNCGKAVHNPGEDFWDVTHGEDLKDPVRFARRLWNTY